MEQENKTLNFILKIINDYLNEELSSFDELEFRYRKDPEHYEIAYRIACNSIKKLKMGLLKPYFARVDFEEKGKKSSYYIGKYGINDNHSNSIVVDWRAPISNLYYDSEIGLASYTCPEGLIYGNLTLKRQYEIENGKLLSYHDVDFVSNDTLLQKYLNENNDMRLKNIVSTIQSEQNIAIRKPLNLNTIVQGVAGSGKTTIALHRLAYLAYNYKDKIKNNQYLVIGPNQVFLKYIASTLPDLDVEGIQQYTYETFSKEIIGEEFTVRNPSKKLTQYLSKKLNNDISTFKNSELYKVLLDKFLDDYLENAVTMGLKVENYEVLGKEKMQQIFQKAYRQSVSFSNAIEKFVIITSKYIEESQEEIIKNLNQTFNQKIADNLSEKDKWNKIRKKIYEEIQKGCKKSAKKMISKLNVSVLKLYENFITSFSKYCNNYQYSEELKIEVLKNIKENTFDFEDLAALIHIKYRLGLNIEFKNYRHVVLDEAQDLGKFNYIVLRECLPNATFSIYGDLVQSIYDYRSIHSWQEVSNIFENTEILFFNKSYRTTDEIMKVANVISKKLNLGESELSIRHGEEVSFHNIEREQIPFYLINKIQEFKEKGYQTIGIISKYSLQSSYLNDDLMMEGLHIINMDEKTDVTNTKISTISNDLAKGLEFDGVILSDVSEEIYDSNSDADMKMLYVALTRALHEMDIVYSGEITKALEVFTTQKCLKRK